jgi:hypothetical protein
MLVSRSSLAFSFICFSCCILFSGWSLKGALILSLCFLLLNHLHNSAETRRPQRGSVLASTLVSSLRVALPSLLRQLRQHDLVVLSSLYNNIGNDGLDALVVAEGASDSLD